MKLFIMIEEQSSATNSKSCPKILSKFMKIQDVQHKQKIKKISTTVNELVRKLLWLEEILPLAQYEK